jgi:hypothetical protein
MIDARRSPDDFLVAAREMAEHLHPDPDDLLARAAMEKPIAWRLALAAKIDRQIPPERMCEHFRIYPFPPDLLRIVDLRHSRIACGKCAPWADKLDDLPGSDADRCDICDAPCTTPLAGKAVPLDDNTYVFLCQLCAGCASYLEYWGAA